MRAFVLILAATSLLALGATGASASRVSSPASLAGNPGGLAAELFRSLGLTMPTGYSNDGSAANRAAAARDARSLLAKVVLPPGASQLGSEPAGDNGYLRPLSALEGDQAHSVAHAWWRAPGTPSQVISFIKAHPPAGGRWSGSGGGQNANGTSESFVSFQWPSIAGVLGSRTVTVTATPLPQGDTGVLVQSQSDWVVLRPWSERIPPTVRAIKITSRAPRAGPGAVALSLTRPSRVRATVRLINSLPVAQPIIYHCRRFSDPRVITITFQAKSGASLAVLTYMDYRPWLAPSIACKTVDLAIGGRRQRPLLGGDFLRTLTTILGRSLV